jgi:tetratricopeptide (TPR) repeat protein
MLKGTAAELDAEFVSIISTPLEKVSGIASNLIQFESEVKKMEAATKIAEKAKKDGADASKKADKKLEAAQKLIDKEEYKKAGVQVINALKLVPDHKASLEMLALINEKDSTLDLKVPEIKEVEAPVKTETVAAEIPSVPAAAIEKAKEPTSMKEVAVEKQQESVEEVVVEAPVATEFDSIEELVEQNPAPVAKVVKTKEQLDIECNSFVDKALICCNSKNFAEAKELLEQGLAIQPTHQRGLIALKKVGEWLVEPAKADKAIAKVESNVAKAEAKEVSQADKDNKPVSLKDTPKPRRKDLEPLADYETRLTAWEVFNPNGETPFKEESKPEAAKAAETFKEKEEAFNAEGPASTNQSTPAIEEDEDDEF